MIGTALNRRQMTSVSFCPLTSTGCYLELMIPSLISCRWYNIWVRWTSPGTVRTEDPQCATSRILLVSDGIVIAAPSRSLTGPRSRMPLARWWIEDVAPLVVRRVEYSAVHILLSFIG